MPGRLDEDVVDVVKRLAKVAASTWDAKADGAFNEVEFSADCLFFIHCLGMGLQPPTVADAERWSLTRLQAWRHAWHEYQLVMAVKARMVVAKPAQDLAFAGADDEAMAAHADALMDKYTDQTNST